MEVFILRPSHAKFIHPTYHESVRDIKTDLSLF
jgi:hypothetical protein